MGSPGACARNPSRSRPITVPSRRYSCPAELYGLPTPLLRKLPQRARFMRGEPARITSPSTLKRRQAIAATEGRLILPFYALGLAVLPGSGTLILTLIGRRGDLITAGITTAVVAGGADAQSGDVLRLACAPPPGVVSIGAPGIGTVRRAARHEHAPGAPSGVPPRPAIVARAVLSRVRRRRRLGGALVPPVKWRVVAGIPCFVQPGLA